MLGWASCIGSEFFSWTYANRCELLTAPAEAVGLPADLGT
jgi:hypothetical protein